MLQVIEQTRDEKIAMYMKLTKRELLKCLSTLMMYWTGKYTLLRQGMSLQHPAILIRQLRGHTNQMADKTKTTN